MQEVIYKLSKDKKRKKALEIEKQLFKYSGLEEKHFKSKDQFITDNDYIHYTEIDKNPEKKKDLLVLVHGFGGSNCIFFRMAVHLSDHFKIITIDLPGMALSSRFDDKKAFDCTNSCINFFVEKINDFFESLKLDQFYLAGHSIGSFFSTHYFDKYHKKVKKLMMLSPAGFNGNTAESLREIKDKVSKMNWFRRSLINYSAKKIFEEKKSPFEMLWSPFRGMFLKKYFGAKRYNFSDEEKNMLVEYNKYVLSLPTSGERCLGYILANGIKSNAPLIHVLDKHKDKCNNIVLFYGERDWMDKDDTLIALQQRDIEIEIVYITKADHQIIMQNAEELSKEVVYNCIGC